MRSALAVLMLLVSLPARAQAPTIAELVAHLDDDADTLHADFTPSVWALCDRGLDGARAIVDLLESPRRDTRMHASRVLECAVAGTFGWHAGRGYPTPDDEARERALWRANGDYAFDMPADRRHASVVRWRAWLTARRAPLAPQPPTAGS